MPYQTYGLPSYVQSPPSPPAQQSSGQANQAAHGALVPRIVGSGGGGVVPVVTTQPQASITAVYRPQNEDKRLTREAMGRYMRERNDMVIVILHAKVRKDVSAVIFRLLFCGMRERLGEEISQA